MPVRMCKEIWSETGGAGYAGDKLPCDLCQGYTLDMEPNADSASATEDLSSGSAGYAGPSLLGSTYLAAQVGLALLIRGVVTLEGYKAALLLTRCSSQTSLLSFAAHPCL